MSDIPEDCMEMAIQVAGRWAESSGNMPDLDRAIAQALADERFREREECCKAVCTPCREGDNFWYHPDNGWEHYDPIDLHNYRCEAHRIRERSQ